jgi:hypothetical protein
VLSFDVIIWDDNTPFFIFPENFTYSLSDQPVSLRCLPFGSKLFQGIATIVYTRSHTRPSQKDLGCVVYPLNNKSLVVRVCGSGTCEYAIHSDDSRTASDIYHTARERGGSYNDWTMIRWTAAHCQGRISGESPPPQYFLNEKPNITYPDQATELT